MRAAYGFGVAASASERLALAGWRRSVAELYAQVRAGPEPEAAHERWRARRDELFAGHPQSPLPPDDPLRRTGLSYYPYDAALRFEAPVHPDGAGDLREVPTGGDGVIRLRRIGRAQLPAGRGSLAIWWLEQYAGGLFVPFRDATAGDTTYGAGRYLLDTAKGADLGGSGTTLTLDLNFAYHPSCRYDPRWQCPLAPPANVFDWRVEAGERLDRN